METIVYGGSFNPPTVAHQAVIKQCLDIPNIDEVWVMPSAERWDKKHGIEEFHRVQMLQIMRDEVFTDQTNVKISLFELQDMPRPTQTWQTVKTLQERYPGRLFRFVFGADAYNSMQDWEHGTELQKTLPMLIVPRNGIELSSNVPNLLSVCAENISSTEVRQYARNSLPIDNFVCRAIADYIHTACLYSDDTTCG